MPRRALVPFALLAALAAAVLLWVGSTREPGNGAPDGWPRPAASGSGPPTEAGEPAPRRPPRSGIPAPAEQEPPATPEPGPEEPSWRLLGILKEFEPGADPSPARVVVRRVTEDWRDPPREVSGETDRSGRFDIDVTTLFPGGVRVLELDVSVDHPTHLPARARLPLEARLAADEGTRVIRGDITVRPAAVLGGRVVEESLRPVAEATVAAFGMTGGEPDREPVDQCTTGPEGRWTLRLLRGGRYRVVAAAAGLRPATVEIMGGDSVAPDLVLEQGRSIEGTVSGPDGAPCEGAVVEAHPVEAGTSRRVGPHEVALLEGRVESSPGKATVGAGGRYHIGGLGAGRHSVRVGDLGPSVAHRVLLDLFNTLRTSATPPATGVDFTVAGSRIVVEVRADGKPLPEAFVLIFGGGGISNFRTDDRGRVEAVGAAGATYTVNASAEGRETARRTVTAPPAGGETTLVVDLVPPPLRGSLRIVLEGEGAAAVDRAGIGLFSPGTERDYPAVTRNLHGDAGTFTLTEVSPGPWDMAVRPGGDWIGGEGYFLEEERSVEMPAEGTAEVRLPIRPAGRLRIAARSPEGKFLDARCEVMDPSGNRVDAWFLSRSPGGGWVSGTGALRNDAPSVVDPALVPGRYRIRLSAVGYLDRVEEVLVEAGRTATVDVPLTRE